MNDWKVRCKKLLMPPVWCLILLTVFSAAALFLVFAKGLDTHPLAYAIYITAFYTLTADCISLSSVLPKQIRAAKTHLYRNQFSSRYLTDTVFRTHVSLNLSLGINLLYVAVNVLSAYLYHTAWFAILAVYYTILAVMRFLLLRYVNQNVLGENKSGEWRRSRICAAILLLINLVLSGAILMILYQDKGFIYPGILIYVMALYTFYSTILAIINAIKARRCQSPVLSTANLISLAAALVSMLSLETAMLTAFGSEMAVETKRSFIAATGAGISIVIISTAAYMIVRSVKELAEER